MNKFIESIAESRKRCVFLSPHFDDALLSCGGLINELGRKVNIEVINVFTKGHAGPYTLSAKSFIKKSGYSNAQELYQERELEDYNALSSIKVEVENLDFEDALFRRKGLTKIGKYLPEFDHIYPIYRWGVVGKPKKELALRESIAINLKKKIGKECIVFVPLGIGSHVDHLIVNEVAKKIFKNIIYYSDFPYCLTDKFLNVSGYKSVTVEVNLDRKTDFLKGYKTQFKNLFPNMAIPMHTESYFFSKE